MIPTTGRRTLQKLIETKSVPSLREALSQYRESEAETYPDFVRLILHRALRYNIVEFVEYLLDHEIAHVQLSKLSPNDFWSSASITLLELLLSHGWNINQPFPSDSERLIHTPHVLQDYELVVFMVEHGAIVDDGDPEARTSRPPPLLELCGPHGTVRSFEYLRSKGAKIGKKTLHLTARAAAQLGADPSIETDTTPASTTDQKRRDEVSSMLRYFVDELGLDLDAIDADGYCFGTPICFAASQRSGADVVKWLLEKGANPRLGLSQFSHCLDAEYWAVSSENKEGARLIKAWKADRDESKHSTEDD